MSQRSVTNSLLCALCSHFTLSIVRNQLYRLRGWNPTGQLCLALQKRHCRQSKIPTCNWPLGSSTTSFVWLLAATLNSLGWFPTSVQWVQAASRRTPINRSNIIPSGKTGTETSPWLVRRVRRVMNKCYDKQASCWINDPHSIVHVLRPLRQDAVILFELCTHQPPKMSRLKWQKHQSSNGNSENIDTFGTLHCCSGLELHLVFKKVVAHADGWKLG